MTGPIRIAGAKVRGATSGSWGLYGSAGDMRQSGQTMPAGRTTGPFAASETDALYRSACELAARLVFEPTLLTRTDISDLEEMRAELARRGVSAP